MSARAWPELMAIFLSYEKNVHVENGSNYTDCLEAIQITVIGKDHARGNMQLSQSSLRIAES